MGWTCRVVVEPHSQVETHAVRAEQMRCCPIVSCQPTLFGADAQRVAVADQVSRQSASGEAVDARVVRSMVDGGDAGAGGERLEKVVTAVTSHVVWVDIVGSTALGNPVIW